MFLFHLWLVDFEETISLNSEVAYLDYYLKILMLNASTVIGKKNVQTQDVHIHVVYNRTSLHFL